MTDKIGGYALAFVIGLILCTCSLCIFMILANKVLVSWNIHPLQFNNCFEFLICFMLFFTLPTIYKFTEKYL